MIDNRMSNKTPKCCHHSEYESDHCDLASWSNGKRRCVNTDVVTSIRDRYKRDAYRPHIDSGAGVSFETLLRSVATSMQFKKLLRADYNRGYPQQPNIGDRNHKREHGYSHAHPK